MSQSADGRSDTSMSATVIAGWWARFERASLGAGVPEGDLPWQSQLAALGLAELRMEMGDLSALEQQCRSLELSPPWSRVRELLLLRVEIRKGGPLGSLHRSLHALDALLATLPVDERATRARACHLRGVIALRHDDLDGAEDALLEALSSCDLPDAESPDASVLRDGGEHNDSPFRAWVLDTIGQVLIRLGAWQEARRTLEAVAATKQRLGDALGTAITVGHLARMQLQLGEATAAEQRIQRLISTSADSLPSFTRLRLLTLLLESQIEARAQRAHDESSLRTVDTLASMMPSDGSHHPLHGFAALALARAASLSRNPSEVERWLARATEASSHPDALELCHYWRARLLPSTASENELAQSSDDRRVPSEAEIGGLLLRAERAMGAGAVEPARDLLERAHDRAVAANNRLWVEWVYRTSRMLDPVGAPERLARRFAGRSMADLERTTVTDATIVFADLVGFTPRSLELEPEEVMATVRSLFELAVPALARFKVRPISCLGDALLAVAEGPDHEERGLSFAIDLVRRASRMTIVRRALGDRWGMDLRSGVASGPVVLGALGNLFKLEFAAIGLTTNLAARLQSSANVGEVICSARVGAHRTHPAHHAHHAQPDRLKLKGFDHEVDVLRFTIDPLAH
ncbi:MAG: adenylate/guanylate cyclase domain-containing protein [Polyangiaceae bacterium]